MNTSSQTVSPFQAARALLSEMQQRFPVISACRPLAIGIDKQLLAHMPDVNKKAMRLALSLHTSSLRYLKAMEKATARFNLDDTPATAVDDTHRQHASQILRTRFKQVAQQRKAKEEQEKADRLRMEKLQQLAAKFAARR